MSFIVRSAALTDKERLIQLSLKQLCTGLIKRFIHEEYPDHPKIRMNDSSSTLRRRPRKMLSSDSLLKKVHSSPRQTPAVSFPEFYLVANELHNRNRDELRSLFRKTGIKITNEDILRKNFNKIAKRIIKTAKKKDDTTSLQQGKVVSSESTTNSNQSDLTWCRIVGTAVVASTLAVECVRQDQSQLVTSLVEIYVEFAQAEGILEWVVDNGGWSAFIKKVRRPVQKSPRSRDWSQIFTKMKHHGRILLASGALIVLAFTLAL